MVKQPTHPQKDNLVQFFMLTFTITWGIGAIAILFPDQFLQLFGKLSDTNPLYYIAVAAPTISATILCLVNIGWQGVGALYARLLRWRCGIRWVGIVLLSIPLLGWLAAQLSGSTPLKDTSTPALLFSVLIYLLVGPLGEELGWRGFALPRLLSRFSPFQASLIIGTIWGVWHLPTFFVSNLVQANLSILIFFVSALCTSFLATWLFQNTAGSVLSTVILHYLMNFSGAVIGAPLPTFTALLLLMVLLALILDKKMEWFRKPISMRLK